MVVADWIVLTMVSMGQAIANPPSPDPEPVVSGTNAALCEFPSAVAILNQFGEQFCTGALVHPRVVLSAAHCFVQNTGTTVTFGESVFAPATEVSVVSCQSHPQYTPANPEDLNPWDLAVCTLATDAPDVPITPPLMGCESEQLIPGDEVTLVGYGFNDESGATGNGIKRWTTNTIESVDPVNNDLFVRSDVGSSVCFGDSGGPAYKQLDDGTWRVVGLTSEAHPDTAGAPSICGFGAVYELVHVDMAWFEATSGFDLTPCFDADGTWNPSEACRDFPGALDDGLDWGTACVGKAETGWSQTCGAGFEENTGTSTGDDGLDTDTSGGSSSSSGGVAESSSSGFEAGTDADPTTGDVDPTTGEAPALPDNSGLDEENTGGCGCRSTRGGAGWLWLVLPALWRGRRRTTRRP